MFNKWLTLNFKGEPLLPVGVIRDDSWRAVIGTEFSKVNRILTDGNGQGRGTSGEWE